MGGIHYVSVLILASLLVFGCLGAPQETPPAGPTTPSGDATTGDTTPSAPSEPAAPTDNLEGLGYEALLALGQALECTITVTDYQGQVMTMKVYMKGEDRTRSEFTGTTQTTCPKYLTIFKDDVTYMGCAGGELFPGTDCDWLMITPEDTGETGPAGFEQPVLEDVPPSKIQCKVWAYDETKFQTPGTVCTMEDFIGAVYGVPQ